MSIPLQPEQERMLLENVKHNPASFQEIYACYFPRIYAYVSYRVGRLHDIEDLVSEIFLRAVEQLHKFQWRGEGSFAAWLFRLAHNRVNDFYRQRRPEPEPISWEELPEIEAEYPLPINTLLRKEKFAQLRRLLQTLSPRRQEIITLKFFGELRNQEIAQLLNLDERTVASHLCRGLEELQRKYLAEYLTTPEEKA